MRLVHRIRDLLTVALGRDDRAARDAIARLHPEIGDARRRIHAQRNRLQADYGRDYWSERERRAWLGEGGQ